MILEKLILISLLLFGVSFSLPLKEDSLKKALEILDKKQPIIDGHNDLAHVLRIKFRNQFSRFNLSTNMSELSHTDIVRARQGRLGAQFWAAYANCSTLGKDALRKHMEQVELLKRIMATYSTDLQFATSTLEIQNALLFGRIASLIGMESGHAIDSSLSILRSFYSLGVRYMTLTHNCNIPWAMNNQVDNGTNPELAKRGLTEFGRLVVKEMNRLGMLVDLSHTSHQTQLDAFDVAEAPVMFSHSSVHAICNHTRNVRDDVLEKLVCI